MTPMVRNLWEVTVDDRKPQPQDQKTAGKAAGQSADCTDYGQPAGSPGGRGGTTCYGGIQRVQPRNKPAGAAGPAGPGPAEKDPGTT